MGTTVTITETKTEKRDNAFLDAITCVWEKSVRGSHHFLSDNDITSLKPYVREALQTINTLIVAKEGQEYVAFIGIQNRKIEMLFVSPESFGKGIGTKLADIAIKKHGAIFVDVNEQNPKAAGFYKHIGFKVFRRDELDDQGNPFPLLRMRLE